MSFLSRSSPATVLLALAALALPAAAQSGTLTGQIRDSAGQPVPSAVFEFESLDDSEIVPFVGGGFTDANGLFTTTVAPLGRYRMTVYPLAAPQSLAVVERFTDIVVSSTPNALGTLELELGVQVSGRVTNTVGTPLVEVDLSFVGPAGEELDFTNKHTDFLGRFTVAMPHGASELHFEPGAPPYYGGETTAPLRLFTSFQASTDLGDVVLPLGWTVSGRAVAFDGTPVEDAQFSFVDPSTGVSAFVPKDRTELGGVFSATLPAGNYDLRIQPRKNDGLATTERLGIAVPPGGDLGTLVLAEGLELAGTVRGPTGTRVGGSELRVYDAQSGRRVFIGEPVIAKGNGSYSAILAAGTYDLEFSPPFTAPFGLGTTTGFALSEDSDLDGSVPALAFFGTSGSGVAGLGGLVPTISATGGTPRLGNDAYRVQCTQARGSAFAAAVITVTPPLGHTKVRTSNGLLGSTQRFELLRLDGLPGVAGAGTGSLPLPIQGNRAVLGQELRVRFLVLDAAAAGGHAASADLVVSVAP